MNTKTPLPALLDATSKTPPSVDPLQPPALSGVIDLETYHSIELPRLYHTLNHTQTRLGSAHLYRSLTHPLDDLLELKARQQTLEGLKDSPAMRQQLEGLMQTLAPLEPHFYDLLFGTFLGLIGSKTQANEVEGYGYEAFIKGTRFLTHAVEGAEAVGSTGLEALDRRLESIRSFKQSPAYQLARGPVYRSEKGIITQEEKRAWTPCIRFNPSMFKPLGLLSFGVLILILGQFVPFLLDLVAGLAGAFWIFLFPLAFLYIPLVGGFDRDGCIYPFRDRLKKRPELHQVLDDIACLDEWLSLLRYQDRLSHPTVFPTLVDRASHYLSMTSVKNPILAAENPCYTGNSIDLENHRLTLITGPNSGGKTAFCKTLAQSQLLAQMGCFVVAESATFTLADRIFHQAPEISQLADGEGRFGTELRRTKAIFLLATPRSLVIMDELSEGTTHEEKIEISKTILDGFAQKGNSTLLITHNHALVDLYANRKDALTLMAAFASGEPTYQMVKGISRVSHADRVAARIGFTKSDIEEHLKKTSAPASGSPP